MIAIYLLSAFVAVALAAQLISCALVLWRHRKRRAIAAGVGHPPLSVLRPVCGLEPSLERTLASTFTDHPGPYEVIFCIDDPADEAIAVVERVIAAYPDTPARLLIGHSQLSGNPKLNNLAKGWAAARHDWVVMIDSNVMLPGDYMNVLFETWSENAGLVTSPPAATEPQGAWAALECAFLNSYQGRWQLAADQVGKGFAQGKTLFWRRDLLESAGGIATLGRDLAEDVAATRTVRAAGREVRAINCPFSQPIGHRSLSEVWQRQLRWARVRRAGFPQIFALEILSGSVAPMAALAALVALGAISPLLLLALPVLWYGAEWLVAHRAGWPATAGQVASWVLRDAMIPALWLSALAAPGFVWRGNAMTPERPATAHPAPH